MNNLFAKLVFIIIGVIGVYFGFQLLDDSTPAGNNYDKCVTLITTINENSSSNEYCTNTEFLGDLVDEYNDNFNAIFTGSKSDVFGRLLVEINGYRLENSEFFFIYVNDIYGSYGIDKQPLVDGVTYELKLGSY